MGVYIRGVPLYTGLNINPLTLSVAKSSLTIVDKFSSESLVWKMFEGEMLIITLSTTLLEIFCKIILNFQVIVKSFTDPKDNFKKTSYYKC